DPGDLALRGGTLDLFPAGYARPLRLDFAGDMVETMREFDAASQRSLDRVEEVLLVPMREFGLSRLTPAAARRVDDRAAEIGLARQERRDLVEAVRGGLVLPGFEQLLPYLYDELATLADYLPPTTLLWMQGPAEIEAAVERGWADVVERAERATREGRFHAPPERLHVSPAAWRGAIAGRPRIEAEPL